MKNKSTFRTICYQKGIVTLLDQTKLPVEEVYVDLKTVEDVAQAIETMVIRGAPAIGLAAAYGMALAAYRGENLEEAHKRLSCTRPTAVNLFWALNRMKSVWSQDTTLSRIQEEAHNIYEEDVESCRKIGEFGAEFIEDGATILTHCNAGALATSEHGTALSVIRAAHNQGKKIKVYADETRPVLQGARLTAWELMKDNIDVTLIPDGAVAHLLGQDRINCAVVGADRITANGDVANKIGTRGVAALMHSHKRPLYVAAPWSTIDMSLGNGSMIPIEERERTEVTHIGGVQVAPSDVKIYNPAFDVTPVKWVSGIITELGAIDKDIERGLARQMLGRR